MSVTSEASSGLFPEIGKREKRATPDHLRRLFLCTASSTRAIGRTDDHGAVALKTDCPMPPARQQAAAFRSYCCPEKQNILSHLAKHGGRSIAIVLDIVGAKQRRF